MIIQCIVIGVMCYQKKQSETKGKGRKKRRPKFWMNIFTGKKSDEEPPTDELPSTSCGPVDIVKNQSEEKSAVDESPPDIDPPAYADQEDADLEQPVEPADVRFSTSSVV